MVVGGGLWKWSCCAAVHGRPAGSCYWIQKCSASLSEQAPALPFPSGVATVIAYQRLMKAHISPRSMSVGGQVFCQETVKHRIYTDAQGCQRCVPMLRVLVGNGAVGPPCPAPGELARAWLPSFAWCNRVHHT